MAHSAVTSTSPMPNQVASAAIRSADSAHFVDRQAVQFYRGSDPLSDYAALSNYPPPYRPTEATAFAHQLRQLPPDGVAGVVVRQQPRTSVAVIRDVNHQVPPVLGMVETATAGAAAFAASGAAREWMVKPLVSTLCPPGLEYLVYLDQLAIFDILLDIPLGTWIGGVNVRALPRRFQVLNALEQQVYSANMNHGDQASHIETAITDRTGQTLMLVKIKKASCPYGVCCCCCYSALEATVEAPPGCTVGTVQRETGDALSFVVKNIEGSSLRLRAREELMVCCGGGWNINPSWEFRISTLDDEQEIGCMKPKRTFAAPYNWRVLTHVALTFPANLNTRMKATLAGAAFFLHYYFFGSRQEAPTS